MWMYKVILTALLCFMSVNAHALNLSRVKTWTNEILTSADLNAEFNNILNHSLTNNDINASAGIVASKINFTTSSAIGSTTPSTGAFTTLTASSTFEATGTITALDKLIFTQSDGNEYIDSLADGYLDLEATTGLRFRINANEEMNLINGILAGTTDNDIDLGSTTKEFKNLWIDGTAEIDILNADTGTLTTIDINGGTMDGVQVDGSTTDGMLFVTDSSNDLSELGSQGTSQQVLSSAGAGFNPTWENIPVTLVDSSELTTVTASGDLAMSSGKLYNFYFNITNTATDNGITLKFNNSSGGTSYKFRRIEYDTSATTEAEATSDGTDDIPLTYAGTGGMEDGEKMSGMLVIQSIPSGGVQVHGYYYYVSQDAGSRFVEINGWFATAPTSVELHGSGTLAVANTYLYEYATD